MTETWYVFYDSPRPRTGELDKPYSDGYEDQVYLFADEQLARKFFEKRRDWLILWAQWESGKESNDYFWEVDDNEVWSCSHIAIKIGKGFWHG